MSSHNRCPVPFYWNDATKQEDLPCNRRAVYPQPDGTMRCGLHDPEVRRKKNETMKATVASRKAVTPFRSPLYPPNF